MKNTLRKTLSLFLAFTLLCSLGLTAAASEAMGEDLTSKGMQRGSLTDGLPVERLFFLNFWKHTMKKTVAIKTVGYQDSNMTMPVLPFMWTVNRWYILGNYTV